MVKRNQILIGTAVLVIAGIGFQFYQRAQVPETQKLSQSVEGFETPPPNASPNGEASAGPVPAATAAEKLSEADLTKYSVLREILTTKNDNDPRFDSELKNLSPELKRAFERMYTQLPAEKRNERGTVAFLIAREMNSEEDAKFLTQVLMEKPCLSLSDCGKPMEGETEEDKHLSSVNEVTANYPQLTTLQQAAERYRALNPDTNPRSESQNPEVSASILKMLEEAANSPNPRVSSEARMVLQGLQKK